MIPQSCPRCEFRPSTHAQRLQREVRSAFVPLAPPLKAQAEHDVTPFPRRERDTLGSLGLITFARLLEVSEPYRAVGAAASALLRRQALAYSDGPGQAESPWCARMGIRDPAVRLGSPARIRTDRRSKRSLALMAADSDHEQGDTAAARSSTGVDFGPLGPLPQLSRRQVQWEQRLTRFLPGGRLPTTSFGFAEVFGPVSSSTPAEVLWRPSGLGRRGWCAALLASSRHSPGVWDRDPGRSRPGRSPPRRSSSINRRTPAAQSRGVGRAHVPDRAGNFGKSRTRSGHSALGTC